MGGKSQEQRIQIYQVLTTGLTLSARHTLTCLNHQGSYAVDTVANSNLPISLTRKLRPTGLSLEFGKWQSWGLNPGGLAL